MAINDPRDIPGLVAWFSAEAAGLNYSDGQTMTGWEDLSGNNNHATTVGTVGNIKWYATGGPSGGPRVHFGSTTNSTDDYFALPNLMASATAAEVHAGFRSVFRSSGLWDFNGNTTLWRYNDTTTAYDSFGWSTGRAQFSDAAVTLNTWLRYDARAAAGAWTARINGTQVYTTSVTVGGWDSSPRLGKNEFGDLTFGGSFTHLLLFSRELTTTERADLDVWLQANPSGGAPTPAGTIAATLPTLAGTFDATYTPPPPAGTIAGTLPGLTGTFNAVIPADGALAGTLPALTGAMGGSSYPVVGTDDTYANDGYNYGGTGLVDYDPPIAATPARVRRSKVQRVHQSLPAPTLENGRPV